MLFDIKLLGISNVILPPLGKPTIVSAGAFAQILLVYFKSNVGFSHKKMVSVFEMGQPFTLSV